MEKKQKTWEECCDEVAKQEGFKDWEAVHHHAGHFDKVKLENKAFELAVSELKKESELRQSIIDNQRTALSSHYNQIQKLKEASNKILEAQSQWQFFAEGYGNGSASISEVNHAATELEQASIELKSLLSKATSDGYTKAKN